MHESDYEEIGPPKFRNGAPSIVSTSTTSPQCDLCGSINPIVICAECMDQVDTSAKIKLSLEINILVKIIYLYPFCLTIFYNPQSFCAACDEMFHKHPKRSCHLRKVRHSDP